MQPLPIFTTWRAEIEAELADAEAEVEEAISESQAADEAQRVARAERAAMNDAVQSLAGRPRAASIASALARRFRGREDVLRQADAKVVTARQVVANARDRVADLQAALQQLDVIAPPPEPAMAEETAELEVAA